MPVVSTSPRGARRSACHGVSACCAALAVAAWAPSASAADYTVAVPDAKAFYGTFEGFGAEWDPFFWNTNNQGRGCNDADWNVITTRMKDLHVGLVRMMMQLDWAQGAADLSQWTWDTPQMKSVFRYLDFCKEQNITVVLTDWGWSVGSLYTGPTDARYAQGVASYLKELVVTRGYTNIKYLVIGNEPDNEIAAKYGNAAYLTMYHNVDAALKTAGIRDKLKVTGPDMGGQWDFMKAAIDGLEDIADAYDFHRYATFDETSNTNLAGDWETLYSHLDMWRGEVLTRDTAGAQKPLLVTEMGNSGGSTNSHPLIDTYDYALHMADYGTTLLNTRIQGGIAWTMHDVYYFDGNQFMQWGMWGYHDAAWKLRPWSQTFGLLIRMAPPGSIQASVNGAPKTAPPMSQQRFAALERPDGGWSLFLVNRTNAEAPFSIHLPFAVTRPFARYLVGPTTLADHPDTIAMAPTDEVSASGSNVTVSVPATSFVVLAEKVPMPEGGIGSSDASSATDAATNGSAGSNASGGAGSTNPSGPGPATGAGGSTSMGAPGGGPSSTALSEGGCSCRVGTPPSSLRGGALVLAALSAAVRRRMRRARRIVQI